MVMSELIDKMAQELDVSRDTAASIVHTILETMSQTLVKGENVEIRGFGSFTVKNYESYAGRNPKTGDVVRVKPKKLPFFKVGKELKEAICAGVIAR